MDGSDSVVALPDTVTVIDAARPAAGVPLTELLRHVDLLLILGQRDLMVRYRQALVGIGWAVLRPAATVAIVVLFFGLLGKAPVTGDVPLAASALIGYLSWQLFATTTADLSESLVRNRHVLTKVYFPRVLIPLSALTVGLVDYLVALLPASAFLLWLGVRPSWPLVLAPLWLAGLLAAAIAGGVLLSALNARYRDVGHVVPFLLQLGFFVCPVIYESAAIIPERYLMIYHLNPIAVGLDGLRWSLVGTAPPGWISTLIAAAVVGGGLVFSWRVFHRLDSTLADRI
jgi:lipopolysaccharide transport system permease protein